MAFMSVTCRDIPSREVAVEGDGSVEHGVHVSHPRDVPGREVAVESAGFVEHGAHISHHRDVPCRMSPLKQVAP